MKLTYPLFISVSSYQPITDFVRVSWSAHLVYSYLYKSDC